ncbi:Putative transcriptional regulator YvhJ [bacterium HR25]|jgi:LCP family protein required for cell wall assembly|nr:Putative transcriptional regulator YvhJ [bacterium HR25]
MSTSAPRRPASRNSAGEGSRYSPLVVFGIALFAMLTFYGVLAVASRLDDYFLPGNQLKLGPLGMLPGVDAGDEPEAATIEQRINVLLLGLDRRPDDPPNAATRTDTVAIVSIDPYSNTAGVLSIPRDLWVEIPDGRGGFFPQRINVAYEFGEAGVVNYPGGGIALIKDTIKHNFGINIDHYVILDFQNFVEIVDTLGGIEVDVPEYVYDPAYNDCNRCPYQFVEFEPGPQQMDGWHALAYARIRYGSDDLRRIERQQQVMLAIFQKATSLGILTNPSRVKSLYDQFNNSVKTDVSAARALGLALKAREIPLERVRMLSLRDAVYSFVTDDGASVLGWDEEKVQQIVARLFLDGQVEAEAARIEVQNGAGIPGLATQVSGLLMGKGLPEDRVSTALSPNSGVARTVIYNLGGKQYTARKLAEWLGLSGDRVVSDPAQAPAPVNGPADIIVLLGTDARTLVSGG